MRVEKTGRERDVPSTRKRKGSLSGSVALGPSEPAQRGDATPWVWRSSLDGGTLTPLPESFFLRDAGVVAPDLLGRCLRSSVGGAEVLGVIVEVEAYVGPLDPASHAAARIGRTRRNDAMFGLPGTAYVFRSYGIHWCLNVVTGPVGFPAAVLIRAMEPLVGQGVIRRRRGGRQPMASGPGRLGEALGVSGVLGGHPLDRKPLELLEGWGPPEGLVAVSGRVGIREAADWPLRFYLRGHPEVSPGPPELFLDAEQGRPYP